jgi:hypothetical protein
MLLKGDLCLTLRIFSIGHLIRSLVFSEVSNLFRGGDGRG